MNVEYGLYWSEQGKVSESLTQIADIFDHLVARYQKTFNVSCTKPPRTEQEDNYADNFMRYDDEELEVYSEPSESQIGYIVDVTVGHIDQFKFHEEF